MDPSQDEVAYIQAMSRSQVVEAYSEWRTLSHSEDMCLSYALESRGYGRLLDLGCGAGRIADHVAGKCEQYLGVDASGEMIEAASKIHPALQFKHQDILSFVGEESSWDTILLMGNILDYLHPTSRRKSLLSLCLRWITDEGYLIGSNHLTHGSMACGYYSEDYHGAHIHNYRASFSEIATEVEGSGFTIAVMCRDYRYDTADWVYWVATPANRSLPTG